jgi:CheY-like chemotaxis protein
MAPAPSAPVSGEAKQEPQPPLGGSETVLVAEDNEAVRRLTVSVLEGPGYTVIEAADGEDALKKIGEHRDAIRLLLLDVLMPKKNGKEVLEETQKIMPGVKALFISGYTAEISHQRGILDKGQEFIAKPFSPLQRPSLLEQQSRIPFARLSYPFTTGIVTLKIVPSPGSLCTESSPLCFLTIS